MAKNKNKIYLTLTIKPTKPKPKKPKPLFTMNSNVYLKYLLIPTSRLTFYKDTSCTDYYFFKEIPFSFKHIKIENGNIVANTLSIFLDVSPHITTEDYEKIFIKSKPSKPTT
jgi:hypothetical protein